MKSEGKLPKTRASSWWRSISRFQKVSVFSIVSFASGSQAWIRSRPAAVSGSSTPPGTTQVEWIFFPARISITSWPNWRRRMPRRATSGFAAMRPMTLRFAGSESWPSRKSGEERWKKESACDWRIWP